MRFQQVLSTISIPSRWSALEENGHGQNRYRSLHDPCSHSNSCSWSACGDNPCNYYSDACAEFRTNGHVRHSHGLELSKHDVCPSSCSSRSLHLGDVRDCYRRAEWELHGCINRAYVAVMQY